jgi:hypothetical protein
MPADQCGRLHHGQRVPPVKPATEPDQGNPRGVGGAPWLETAFAVQRELFAQEEVFRGQGRGWA